MTIQEFKDYKAIEVSGTHDYETYGVIYLNDNSHKSDFIFSDWNIPIIRSRSNQAKDTEELITFISKKILPWEERNQDCFFLTVTFNENVISAGLSLNFSPNCNFNLIHPVYENLKSSKIEFNLEKSYKNSLISSIEGAFSKVSCFELNFGSTLAENNTAYSKEKIFEEILIFANLAVSKKLK